MIKRKHVLQTAICIALVMVLAAGVLQTSSAKAVTTTCVTYSGSNVEYQNYTTWSKPIMSYLYYCSDGSIMRVQAGSSIGGTLVEYYDTSYNLKSSKIVEAELPIFGGFYAMGGYYYLLTGQQNANDSDDVEVFRITKYDTNWNRKGSASLYGANTYIPFDAGSARFASTGNYLLIRTAHEMYAGTDGVHHQANVTIEVDTSTMTITDSFTSVANISAGYVSHSFNQFIQLEDNKIVAVDHGDAYPRSIVLTKYSKDVTTGTFGGGYNSVSATNLITFEGAVGANYTGASVGGFEISDTAYIVVGSQDIDSSSNYIQGRDIFVAAQDKSTGTVTVTNLTNYTAGSGTTNTPHLVKITSNNYLVLWSRGTTVYYTQIDGNGKQTGSTYSMTGSLSDCVPVLINGKVIWYTWNNGTITFYEIPVSSLSSGKSTVIENGHQYEFGTEVSADGTVSRKCKQCGESDTVTVPTSFSVWWKDKASTGYYWSSYSSWLISGTNQFPVGLELLCWLDPSSAQYNEMVAESSNPDVIAVGTSGSDKLLTMKKPGISVVTVYPKYNPGIARTYTMRVGENGSANISSCTATLSQTKYTYTGSAFTPAVTVKMGNATLVENADYTVSYSDNKNVGTATVTITGKGLFAGTLTKTFTIEGIKISDSDVKLGTSSYTYDGTAKTPTVTVTTDGKTLTSGTDYTVAYTNNTNAGTATVTVTGKGNYSGTVSKTFTISAASITGATVTLGTSSYTYDGTAKKPTVTVKVGSKTLTSGTDYSVAYTNNTNAGTATVTVTGKGNYSGTKTATFTINALSITGATVTLGTTSYTYDNTAKQPSVTVKLGTKTLTNNTDYTVTYSNNTNIGTATVKITGKNNYAGSVSKTFEIIPEDVQNVTTTSGEKSITVTWDAVAGAEGYRVYRYNASQTKWDQIATTSSRTYTDTGLTGATTYKYAVRAYKTVSGKTYLSSSYLIVQGLAYLNTVTGISATAGTNGIAISWNKVTGAEKYRVYYKTGSGSWTKIADTTATNYTWAGAKVGTTYKFTVRCINSAATSFTSDYDKDGVSFTYVAAPKISSVSNVNGGVQINWGKVTGAVNYRVYYKTGSGSWTKIADTTGTSYTWTGAKSGTTYAFTVRCINSDATCFTSSYDTVGTSVTYVAAPKVSSVTNVSNGVQINWGAVAGAVNYRVYYKTGTGIWTRIAETTETSYTWTGAKSGTTYSFTVRCMSSDASSYASGYDSVGKSLTYIAAPKITSVSNENGGVQINWDAVTGAEKYRVFYRPNANSSWTKITDTTETSYTWTGAKSGTFYIFTVRCISDDGENYTSSYDSTGKSLTYVAAPKISSVSNVNGGVQINWGAVTGAVKYRVYYKTGSGSWTKIADTTATSYTWTGAKSGTTYTFTVRCINSDATSFTSGYDSTGKSVTYVAAPQISSLSSASNGVQIKWGAVDGAVKYRVFYRTSTNSGWTQLTDTTSTSYTWTGAKSGTSYIFTVRCISSDGTSYTSSYDATGKTITYTK